MWAPTVLKPQNPHGIQGVDERQPQTEPLAVGLGEGPQLIVTPSVVFVTFPRMSEGFSNGFQSGSCNTLSINASRHVNTRSNRERELIPEPLESLASWLESESSLFCPTFVLSVSSSVSITAPCQLTPPGQQDTNKCSQVKRSGTQFQQTCFLCLSLKHESTFFQAWISVSSFLHENKTPLDCGLQFTLTTHSPEASPDDPPLWPVLISCRVLRDGLGCVSLPLRTVLENRRASLVGNFLQKCDVSRKHQLSSQYWNEVTADAQEFLINLHCLWLWKHAAQPDESRWLPVKEHPERSTHPQLQHWRWVMRRLKGQLGSCSSGVCGSVLCKA